MKYLFFLTVFILTALVVISIPGLWEEKALAQNSGIKDSSEPKISEKPIVNQKECPPVDDDAISRLGDVLTREKEKLRKKERLLASKEEELRAYEESLKIQRAELVSLLEYIELKGKKNVDEKENNKLSENKKMTELAISGLPKTNNDLLSQKDKKLSEIISNLKPKAAAKMLDGMESYQGARIIYALESGTAAKILQKMTPEKAASVTGIIGTLTSSKKKPLKNVMAKLPESVVKKEARNKAVEKKADVKRKNRKTRKSSEKAKGFKPYNSRR
ncbi:MAG: hypothetical protein JXR95_16520 [Deltaproteobacteria bacterium]|nr:hypothetical protein [Deltaproteobacteria bacterium]